MSETESAESTVERQKVELQTKIVQLPALEFHGDTRGYYQDARRDQAPPIVGLLKQLQEAQVDRGENPILATFQSGSPSRTEQNLIVEAYHRSMAQAIVDMGEEVGLHIEVSVGRSVYGEKSPAEQLAPKEVKGWMSRTAQRLGMSTAQEPQPQVSSKPDYQLVIAWKFDRNSSQQDLRGSGSSFTRLDHTVSLKPSESES